MKQKEVVFAFLENRKGQSYSLKTNGKELFLHGNKIAEKVGDSYAITTCGWNSKTTLKYLRIIPFCSVYTKGGRLFLNGEPWDGERVIL